MSRPIFYHTVNGRTYNTVGLDIQTMAQYKAVVAHAYGSLRGVTFSEEAQS